SSTVQAFHRQGGVEQYPSSGIVPWPVRIGEEITLDVAARGQLLNVWVNGELAIAYTMPLARQEGAFALWTHQATAEFAAVLLATPPGDLPLAQSASGKTRSPYEPPRREDLERALEAARRAARIAAARRAAARGDLRSLEARIAADRARLEESPEA